jgi:hypothetical protein
MPVHLDLANEYMLQAYEVVASSYSSVQGLVPSFDVSCQGVVDQPLTTCNLISSQGVTVLGNFSTYETSGVGSGLIDITASWIDQAT